MRVIADASPLRYLILIGHVYVTPELIEAMLERNVARKRQTSRPNHA